MKKIIVTIICAFAMVALMPVKVLAAGGFSVSTAGVTLHPGESATISVTASNAAGRINISSSNPGVASVSTGAIFLDNSADSVTITAGSVGSATISLVASEFSTYDEEILSGQARAVAVNVVPVPAPAPAATPTPASTPAATPAPAATPKNNTAQEEQPKEEAPKSNNTNLTLAIDGYEFEQDGDSYKTTVPHDISIVNIDIKPEDKKTTINGGGEIKLQNGENIIEVVATAEDGTTRTYRIEITREEACKCPGCEKAEPQKQSPIFLITTIIEGICLAAVATVFVIKKVKKSKKVKEPKENNLI